MSTGFEMLKAAAEKKLPESESLPTHIRGGQGRLWLLLDGVGVAKIGNRPSLPTCGDVVELAGAKIVPSTKPGSVTPRKLHIGEPGEIELYGRRLLFVTKPQGDRLIRRVDLQSGDIGFSSGAPVEIYSEWSIQDGADVPMSTSHRRLIRPSLSWSLHRTDSPAHLLSHGRRSCEHCAHASGRRPNESTH
jgi:hypothetical protein